VIDLILCVVAVFLAYESKGLLIGEGVDERTRASINRIVVDDPDIDRLVQALSMHFGPQYVLVTMEIQFRPHLSAAQTAAAIDRLDQQVKAKHPEIRHLFIEAQSIVQPAHGATLHGSAPG
jgi:divalent metal cation (Fe/Co/Zn/Cd) transporter